MPMRKSLLLWLTIASLALAMAPPPPPSPVLTLSEIRGLQESIDRALASADRWQQLRGDRQIPWAEARGHMAIVIDDIGRELHLFEQLYGLRYRLTFSVLPWAVYSAGVQLRLRSDRRRPREILLHLPMEPRNRAAMARDLADGQVFLQLDDPPATLRAKTEAALARVPAAIGVNNHMGSALTADRDADDTIVQLLHERDLFVLDSLTGPDSVLFDAAVAAGVPALRRSFFLDHDPKPKAIEHQLELAAAAALQEPVVVIAHPSSAVVEILRRELPRLHSKGITVVPLSKLLQRATDVGDR
ncbi:MAG TPA: divergent polysaccharide deacetylase family protein [Nannocystis exedens]|nr:divergent polysaccharide deacetylase family protein [Nannocystis exedens]